jgi:peptide/nickel transport system substrate-binding protein
MRNLAVVALALVSTACGERSGASASGEPGGTLVISTTVDPGTLFPPFAVSNQAKQITEQIYDYLADVGVDLNTHDEKSFRPALADRWGWSGDSLILAFHINPRAKWHDGKAVTARDVQFTFALNKNPALGGRASTSLANIDSVTVRDSLTPVFWFREKLPTRFLDAAAQLLILPAHQLEKIPVDSLRVAVPPPPIGSGRFRLRRWDRGASVELVADTANYRGRAKLDRVIWSVSPEFTTAVTKLFTGDADLFDALRPENLRQLARQGTLRTITLPGMDYAFLRFNLKDPANRNRPHPLFGDRELRRAITMSLNRSTLVRSVLDTFALVPVGPVVRAYSTTDPRGSQLPFDSVRASRLLDSLGWIRGADGMRSKNGEDLAFSLIIPSSSLNRIRMGPLIQEQLRRMGIRMELEQLEGSTMADREARGAFDASLGAWVMASSQDGMRDAWGSSGIGKNGVNYGSYSNPRFDALLDSALWAAPAQAREKFSAAYAIINDDAPAVWLYEPRKLIGIHRRIQTTPMRPDAWWFGLADWSIRPSGRILRDRLPPRR